jgi:hypothetical protein
VINVISYRKTCPACPAQWEGVCSDGRFIYIRFRWGSLTWGVGNTIELAVDDSFACLDIISDEDSYNGYMEDEEMKKIMAEQNVYFGDGN